MIDQEGGAKIKAGAAQFGRFALVGVSNTAVDLAVTNALVFALSPRSSLSLMLISVTACSVATMNSYLLNRRWTFKSAARGRTRGEVSKFFGIALLSMIVNTSVFLFVARYLPDRVAVGHLAAINIAKLAGVASAFAASFLGYRFGVFQTEQVYEFRSSFQFETDARISFLPQAVVLVSAAAGVRLLYLLFTTAVFGDAVNYGWVADALAAKDFSQVDLYWSSLYGYWEALFRLLGVTRIPAAIAASFVPGTLLAVPVAWIGRALYGSGAAWLAGLLTATHPRLVEYSCNGYPEMFYLLAFAAAIAFLVRVLQGRGYAAAVGWGSSFGFCLAVRIESLIAFLLSLLCAGAIFCSRTHASRKTGEYGGAGVVGKRLVLLPVTAALAFLLTAGSYMLLSEATIGNPGLFQKAIHLARQFSQQPDLREAGREGYRLNAGNGGTEGVLGAWLRKLPRNALYSLERLPGVFFSPMLLFAVMLPLFAARRGRVRGDEVPLLLMFFFPLLFYPLIQVEPRLFLPLLIPVHVFGAAGLAGFCAYASRQSRIPGLCTLFAAVILIGTLGLSMWRGFDVERNHRFHRELAGWIERAAGPKDVIVGCGYGYAATTGFLAGHHTISTIWADSAARLADFAEQKSADWIILYEPFLHMANPELLPVLDTGLPGYDRVFEATDPREKRCQIFRRRSVHHARASQGFVHEQIDMRPAPWPGSEGLDLNLDHPSDRDALEDVLAMWGFAPHSRNKEAQLICNIWRGSQCHIRSRVVKL